MLTNIIFNIPFAAFFLYAIYTCRQKQKIESQPATLAFYVFCILFVKLLLTVLFTLISGGKTEWGAKFVIPLFQITFWLLFIALLICVFAWRNTGRAEYKRPAILAGIATALKIITLVIMANAVRMAPHYTGDIKSLFTVVSSIIMVLNLTVFVLLLWAIFGWRGYPKTEPDPIQKIMGVNTSDVPTTGIFHETDFIPYVCGIMILGGMLIVPILWGEFMNTGYIDALFPALISCGVFAYSHDKRGNFLWGRFIVVTFFMYFIIMQSVMKHGGNGRPMFMAGGLVGFIIMFGCGWAGIALGRLMRRI